MGLAEPGKPVGRRWTAPEFIARAHSIKRERDRDQSLNPIRSVPGKTTPLDWIRPRKGWSSPKPVSPLYRDLALIIFFGSEASSHDKATALRAAWDQDSKRQADNATTTQVADSLHGAAASIAARERTGRWHAEASDPIIGFVALTHAAEPVNDPEFAAGTCRHRATLHLHSWETEYKGRPVMIALERVRLIYATGGHAILPGSLLGEKERQREGIESVPGAIEMTPVSGDTLLGGRVLDYEWIATLSPGARDAAPVTLTVEALSSWFRVWDPKAPAMPPKEGRAKKVVLDALIKARREGEEGSATPLATGTLRFDDLP